MYRVSAWYHDASVEVKLNHSEKCVCRRWTSLCSRGRPCLREERKYSIVSSHLVLGEGFVVFWFLVSEAGKLAKTSKAHTGKDYQSCM